MFLRIHLWDLGAGDIYPAHTVQFGDQVNCFSLSCDSGDPGQRQMLAIGLEDGRYKLYDMLYFVFYVNLILSPGSS